MAEYYVSSAGNDSNSGSPDTPWLTVGHALANSSAGDSIFLNRGDTFSNTGLYTLENRTLGAYGYGARPIITSSSNTTATITVQALAVLQDVEVSNTGASNPLASCVVGNSGKIKRCKLNANTNKCLTFNGHGCIVEDCHLTDEGVASAQLATFFNASSCVLRRCYIERHNAVTGVYSHVGGGYQGDAGNNVVEHCWIRGETSTDVTGSETAVRFDDIDVANDVGPTVVRYCRIDGVWDYSIDARRTVDIYANFIDATNHKGNYGIAVDDADQAMVIGNTIVWGSGGTNTPPFGVLVIGGSTGHVVKNNAVWYSSISRPYGQQTTHGTTNFSWDYNAYDGSTQSLSRRFYLAATLSNIASWLAAGYDANGSIDSALGFVSAGGDVHAGAYVPASGSLLVGAGQSVAGMDTRLGAGYRWYDGTNEGRFVIASDSAVNIGAFSQAAGADTASGSVFVIED